MPWLRMLQCGLLLAACSSALLGAGCAGTPPGPSGIEGTFIRAAPTWDLNHDGKVSCEEWRTYAASLFKEADSDHDGKLTRGEFAKLPKIDRLFEVANFDYYDENRQGYFTRADFVDRPNPAFAALDHDKRCVINPYQVGVMEARGGRKPTSNTSVEDCISKCGDLSSCAGNWSCGNNIGQCRYSCYQTH